MTGRSRAAARTGRVPLTGRHEELRALSDLVAGVRDGMSAALVVVGEAGIGKTTLLDHLAETSHDLRVVRTAGTESEARACTVCCGPSWTVWSRFRVPSTRRWPPRSGCWPRLGPIATWWGWRP
ncbi:AAA family ATPase [Streptomyces sp. NPDC048200]|uniref:AAA family ATPase n=1 Tax=Streptomyces sp. NPDC048200 TaxID=3365512 RepID=UPI00371EDCFD